jgi:hypothetical protein
LAVAADAGVFAALGGQDLGVTGVALTTRSVLIYLQDKRPAFRDLAKKVAAQ